MTTTTTGTRRLAREDVDAREARGATVARTVVARTIVVDGIVVDA